jgi:hypothetical protein
VTDQRHVGHLPDHGVAIDALGPAARAVPAIIIEQVAKHHRDINIDGRR